MKTFWDQRYSEPGFAYGQEPNAYFQAYLDAGAQAQGRLLLPGEGEGRNAVYAAKKGWDVFAFDQSEVGKEKALQLAREKDVQIHYEVADLSAYPFEADSFDLIGLFFFHLPKEIRIQAHAKFVHSLKPGGRLIAEFFSPKQLGKPSGGPPVLEMLYDIAGLKEDFKDLDIQYLAEEDIILEEGKFHQGAASVVRLLAQKEYRI